MADLVFVDTNIVIYTRDTNAPDKAKLATDWIRALRDSARLVVSPQVVNEAYAVSTRKFDRVPRGEIRLWLRNYLAFCIAPMNAAVVAAALALEQDSALQWWDCLIVASALAANCAYILSEDMQHGRRVRSAEIVNPFLVSPSELATRL